jgi:hypothetical protein
MITLKAKKKKLMNESGQSLINFKSIKMQHANMTRYRQVSWRYTIFTDGVTKINAPTQKITMTSQLCYIIKKADVIELSGYCSVQLGWKAALYH